ncbi:MAG TPA: phosphatase PAP2 family protein [Actinomycetota bacterium]|nr:phosphatase PAP2 family protein [Actinomycetota bacterium]
MPRRDTAVTIALAVATGALFLLMAAEAGRDLIQPIDDAFLRWMVSIRTPTLTFIAMALNLVGLTFVMTPIRLGITAWLAIRRRWWHLTAFVSAIVVSEIAIGTLKALYDRPRALGSLVETSSASFPSGHAVAASVTAVAAVIALLPEGPRRYRWGAGAVAFSFLMAVSRTYLGAHWLSDAVAGVLLGTTIALGTAVITHRVRERREGAPGSAPAGNVG